MIVGPEGYLEVFFFGDFIVDELDAQDFFIFYFF